MAGAKTRFGFAGDGSEPPDSDEARSARTLIGRDMHLRLPPGSPSPGSPSAQLPVAGVVPTPIPVAPAAIPRGPTTGVRGVVASQYLDENTEELPSRGDSRGKKSRLARFLGRWTKSGRFVSDSRYSVGTNDLDVPRDPLARNVLLVLLVATLTFLLTLAMVKLRQHFARHSTPADTPALRSALPAPSPPPSPAAGPSAQPAASPSVQTVARPASPASPPQAPGTPVSAGSSPEVPKQSSAESVSGPTKQARRALPRVSPAPAVRARVLAPVAASPAALPAKPNRVFHGAEPPPHLKGELLPLGP